MHFLENFKNKLLQIWMLLLQFNFKFYLLNSADQFNNHLINIYNFGLILSH